MSGWHVIKQGEVLAHLARDAGFHDPATVWDAPENLELRRLRPDPNVLQPGDRLYVPERVAKEVAAATGRRHVYELATTELALRLRVLDAGGTPHAFAFCELNVGDVRTNATDADGRVERPIAVDPAGPRPLEGGLVFPNPRLVFHLKIGKLNPEDDVEGQQARLNNLGYFAGYDRPPVQPRTPEEREQAQQLRWAIEEFQCDHRRNPAFADLHLVVDGVIDKRTPNGRNTQKALVRAHGC